MSPQAAIARAAATARAKELRRRMGCLVPQGSRAGIGDGVVVGGSCIFSLSTSRAKNARVVSSSK
jgi:hypothetical protein